MQNANNILLDEEPIIYFPSTTLNYGVLSKKTKPPKNLCMSFTPLSTNKEISFSNTIMYPCITTEATLDTEKNMSHLEIEKSKQSLKKESTGFKTESSKEERNNFSYEKQITKNLSESNEISDGEENSNEHDTKPKEKIESIDSLEINPFFLGVKSSFEMNKYIKENDNCEIEEQKVQKILNKGNNLNHNENNNLYYKTSKNINNNINDEIFKNKLIRKTQKMKSLNLTKSQKVDSSEKESQQNKIRKSQIKHKTFLPMENMLLKHYNNNIHNKRYSAKKFDFKNNFTCRRNNRRELTVMHNNPLIKIKDHNIKMYRANLFDTNSSKKVNKKFKTNIIKEKIQEKDEEDKSQKSKPKKIGYFGMSDTSLNTKLYIGTPKNKKIEDIINAKKLLNKMNKEAEVDSKIRTKKRSESLIGFKRMKTFDTSEKKKNQNIIKKKPEQKKTIDFEKYLKNKNNLANTQFNLFSPDKFTNTQFCGSDYCEYTLNCMELILNENKSQKQIKSKVNFNFPKQQKNKPKKKIALFDLDETLVHCTGDINLNKEEQYQYSIDIVLPGNKEVTVGINVRPHWKKTLNMIRKYYHIVVFTASHQAYADAVLDFMDPSKKYFKYRLYRNNCSLVDVEGTKFYVKDLDIFDEFYDLKDIVIIDNSVLSFIYHLENGIPIVPYYSEDKDSSLYVVGLYLMHIYKENDLREANKKYINLDSFLKEARERKDLNSTINEESISIESNNNKNEDNEKISNNNDNISNNKLDLNKVNITTNEKENKGSITNRKNSKGNSLQSEKEHQNKLISQSKLINMYYSINDKCVSKFNSKNKNNITTDEEKDLNDNDNNKDNISLFLNKRLLTNQNESRKSKITFKYSNKTCREYLDLKLVCSNFNNNFYSEKFI